MAAGLSVDLDRWRQEFDELMLRVGGRQYTGTAGRTENAQVAVYLAYAAAAGSAFTALALYLPRP